MGVYTATRRYTAFLGVYTATIPSCARLRTWEQAGPLAGCLLFDCLMEKTSVFGWECWPRTSSLPSSTMAVAWHQNSALFGCPDHLCTFKVVSPAFSPYTQVAGKCFLPEMCVCVGGREPPPPHPPHPQQFQLFQEFKQDNKTLL